MYDMRTYYEKKKGFWMEADSIVPCMVTSDGLLVVFELLFVKELLDAHYPFNKEQGVWFFSETRDREIAEIEGDRVYANPQLLYSHFLVRRKKDV
jgi:hypothetical protein